MQEQESMTKKSEQISVRLDPETYQILAEIHRRHGLEPVTVARRCLEEVAAFYKTHGFFAFPVRVWPEQEFLKAAAAVQIIDTDSPETQAAKKKAPRTA